MMNINTTNINITSLFITKNGKLKITLIEIITSIIAAIMLIIPIIINIYLSLYRIIKVKNTNKGKIINKLYKEEKGENEDNEDEDEDEEIKEEEPKKVIFPKRIILLNYFFDFHVNIKELFNFKSNLTIVII